MCPITFHPQSAGKPDCTERAKSLQGSCLGQKPLFIPSPCLLPSKQALQPFLCKMEKPGCHGSYKHVQKAPGTWGACEQSVQGQRENLIPVPSCQRKVCSSQVPVTHECWLLRAKQKEQEGKCRAPRRQKDWKQNENKKNQFGWTQPGQAKNKGSEDKAGNNRPARLISVVKKS